MKCTERKERISKRSEMRGWCRMCTCRDHERARADRLEAGWIGRSSHDEQLSGVVVSVIQHPRSRSVKAVKWRQWSRLDRDSHSCTPAEVILVCLSQPNDRLSVEFVTWKEPVARNLLQPSLFIYRLISVQLTPQRSLEYWQFCDQHSQWGIEPTCASWKRSTLSHLVRSCREELDRRLESEI
jgi:hypothetical protein